MTREEFAAWCAGGVRLLDGATGTNLARAGMPKGVCSEAWVLEHPQPLQKLQRAYVESGSEVVYASTFGANAISLERFGLQDRVREMNTELVRISREAVGNGVLVAGDMTTTGQPVEPYGTLSYDRLIEAYREQAQALCDGGVDLFAVETMMGVMETVAAVEAIRSVCELPILCTMSLQTDGKAYFDGSGQEAAESVESLGADAFGINCSFGPDQLESLVANLHRGCGLPIVAKPNAGLPIISETGEAVYSMEPEDFAKHMQRLTAAGAALVGGCCGTSPEYIRALKQILA